MPDSSRLQSMLTRLTTENLGLKLVALGSATLIWAWVQNGEVVEARTRVDVDYAWPDGLVRARQVPKTLVATVSGPQGVVKTIQRGSLSVQVDLSEASQGPTSVDFTELELAGLPLGVQVVQLSPPAIDVELDRALTKEVQVRPTLIGEPAAGWAIASIEVEPESLRITGPQEKVRGIAQISTDVLDIGGAREDKYIDASLAITDPVVELARGEPQRIRVTVDIEPVIVERTFESVPVLVGGSGWTTPTQSVRLTMRGPQEAVGGIRADKVAVVLTPPEGTAIDATRLDLSWSREGAAGIRIEQDSPGDQVEVVRLDPRRFHLERAQ